MLEAIRKKQEEKEAKLLAQRNLGNENGKTVLFRTTVKGKGGFLGEETTYSDGTTSMKVITPAKSEEAESTPKKVTLVRARLSLRHPVVSLPASVVIASNEKYASFPK
jgi:hypothetical protein